MIVYHSLSPRVRITFQLDHVATMKKINVFQVHISISKVTFEHTLYYWVICLRYLLYLLYSHKYLLYSLCSHCSRDSRCTFTTDFVQRPASQPASYGVRPSGELCSGHKSRSGGELRSGGKFCTSSRASYYRY